MNVCRLFNVNFQFMATGDGIRRFADCYGQVPDGLVSTQKPDRPFVGRFVLQGFGQSKVGDCGRVRQDVLLSGDGKIRR